MPKLIGLTGAAGVGKDTIGDRLYWTHGYISTSFAEPLRLAACEIFGLEYSNFADRDRKDTINEQWGMTPRQMIQRLGTEGMRHLFGEDFWIKRWRMVYDNSPFDNFVVTDVRFDNEASMIRELGGTVVHVFRADTRNNDPHLSAQGVPYLAGDHVIENYGDIKALYERIEDLLKEMG
jgi:hypothetical protein